MRKLFAVFALLFAAQCFAATLYISEYTYKASIAIPAISVLQAVQTPEITRQIVAIAGVSAQSVAFNTLTQIIRVHTDTACSVQIGGTNPTATLTSAKLEVGATEYFIVAAGDKLAVIANP